MWDYVGMSRSKEGLESIKTNSKNKNILILM